MDKNGLLPAEQISHYENTLSEIELAIERNEDDFTIDQSLDDELQRVIRVRKLDIQKDTPEYEHLKREYKFANSQYCRDVLAYNKNIRDYDLTPVRALTQQPTESSGITLKQAVDDFIAERQRGEAWTDRTLKDRTAQLALLCEVLGESTDLAAIDAHKVAEIKKLLQALPKNRNKNAQTRHLPLKEMALVPNVEKMNARTVNEYLTVYQSLFGWAARQGYIVRNAFEGSQIPVGKNRADARAAFSRELISTILHALPEYTQDKTGKSFQYWGIMLAIYTGARLNEIAQLALDDIKQENGIWYFNITDEGDDKKKRLKNQNSKRHVPIHDMLLSNNLIQHVEKLRQKKQTRLFPDLAYQKGHGYGRELTRWNTRLLKQLGIKEKRLTFHSYRHTIATALHNAGAQEGVIDALLGHAQQGTGKAIYLKGYELPLLKETIDKVTY